MRRRPPAWRSGLTAQGLLAAVLGCGGQTTENAQDDGGIAADSSAQDSPSSGGSAGTGGSAGVGGATLDAGGGGACVLQLAAGWEHTCAVKGDHSLWCWGNNDSGQIGDGTKGTRITAVRVDGVGPSVSTVSAGGGHTCAVDAAGTLWCWGANWRGQLGDGTKDVGTSQPVQISALGSSVSRVSAGYLYTCAVKVDGTLWCWGANSHGQAGVGTKADQLLPAQVASGVSEVATGDERTCAVKTDGTLWCWGAITSSDGTYVDKTFPEQIPADAQHFSHVTVGTSHNCAINVAGKLSCWGWNWDGQLGNGTFGSSTASATPVEVTSLGGAVVGLAAGQTHSCAVEQGGTLSCWGSNAVGQLGNGAAAGGSLESTPVLIDSLGPSGSRVSTRFYHTCALRGDGTPWCWGANVDGRLGDGTVVSKYTPVPVVKLCP
ncbi:MAG: hypothetical protein IPI67_36950 [Myxococcales bacterium]|nr:hypothetical protein [Myxococcales bacterium]